MITVSVLLKNLCCCSKPQDMGLLYKALIKDAAEFVKYHPDPNDPDIKPSDIRWYESLLITLCVLMLIGQRREFISRMVVSVIVIM